MRMSDFLKYPHHLSPHQVLVASLFSTEIDYCITIDEMIIFFEQDSLRVDRQNLESAIDYFIYHGCLMSHPCTRQYCTLD